MSQAFVKEGDASEELPERPVSEKPNYVTADGLAELRRRRDELLARRSALSRRRAPETEAELKLAERDLRYFEARLESAILVERHKDRPLEAIFGTTVEVADSEGRRRYTIVGEDEADPAQGKISWCSPLALALMGAKPGDEVSWPGPDGEKKLGVVAIF
jgi:transcription elongation GreA/GreB family factor